MVAGHGVNGGVLGERFGIDEGVLGRVFMTGEPVLVCHMDGDFPERRPRGQRRSARRRRGSDPLEGQVRGALWVGTSDPARTFAEHDLDSLAGSRASAPSLSSRRTCAITSSCPSGRA